MSIALLHLILSLTFLLTYYTIAFRSVSSLLIAGLLYYAKLIFTMLVRNSDFRLLEITRPAFICDPFIPQESITLLYGRSTVGKTPWTYTLAAAISTGRSFLGEYPCVKAPVLYIELDMSPQVTQTRILQHSEGYEDWMFSLLYDKDVNILHPTPIVRAELEYAQELHGPKLVIVDTLRKCHALDENDSTTPSRVYKAWQHLFPGSALLFVHHERKQSTQAQTTPPAADEIRGTSAWLSDATTAIRLTPHGAAQTRFRQEHVKAHGSELVEAQVLQITQEGSWVELVSTKRRESAMAFLATLPPNLPAREIDSRLAAHLGCTERWARRVRLGNVGTPA